jgi:hypothetical protein
MDGQFPIGELLSKPLPVTNKRWIASQDERSVRVGMGLVEGPQHYVFYFLTNDHVLPLGYESVGNPTHTMRAEIQWHEKQAIPSVARAKFFRYREPANERSQLPWIEFVCSPISQLSEVDKPFDFDISSVPEGTKIQRWLEPGEAPTFSIKGKDIE